jgi:hypothetical protein
MFKEAGKQSEWIANQKERQEDSAVNFYSVSIAANVRQSLNHLPCGA